MATEQKPEVRCECFPKCESLASCDAWECSCGNNGMDSGFTPCDSLGNAVEPTPDEWPIDLYRCLKCDAIFQMDGTYMGQAIKGARVDAYGGEPKATEGQ